MAKDRAKISRKELRRQELERQRRVRMLQIGIPVGLGLIVLAVLIGMRFFAPSMEGLVEYGPQERGHDQSVTYPQSPLPPVGGVHDPRWQNCGIYDQPVEIKNAIHSMEHGAVWITYQPDLPAGDVATLRQIVGDRGYILMSPYPGLASKVVLTAWSVQLQIDSLPDERIEKFIDRYRQGPQTPELGASCTGGIGVPTG